MRQTFNRLLVSDFRASFRFYRDVVGLTPTWGDENDVYADFDTGGTPLALFRRDLMAEAVGASGKPVYADCQDRFSLIFTVEDVDAACAQLEAQGVQIVTAPADHPDWGIRTAHFRDPDGNLLEVNAPLKA